VRSGIRAWITTLSLVLSPCALAVNLDASAEFTISPQPLATALIAFAKQAQVQILSPGIDLAKLKAPAVRGRYSISQVLQMLLAGTGLTYASTGENTIVVSMRSGDERSRTSSSELRVAEANQTNGTQSVSVDSSHPSETTATPFQLEEVVVTAQKRVERLIDTPQSVSVVSADELAKLGAVQFRDFANTVPGLNYTTSGPGFTQISLRGVTAGFDVNSTVGIYVDEVPYGTSGAFAQGAQSALDVGLFDLQRVEVLRGPQGTLYGASTMGGLIKYVTKTADLTAFSADVQAGTSGTERGSVNYNGSLAVNLPIISDRAAVRASIFGTRDGGYIDDVALDRKNINRSSTYGGRLDLLFTPMDTLSVRLSGFLQNISSVGDGTVDYSFSSSSPAYRSLDQYRQLLAPFEQRFRLVSGTVNYNLGPATLTSVSSYQTVHSEYFIDESQTALPGLFQSFFNPGFTEVADPFEATTDKFTQEVRLGSTGTPVLEWLVGGFYTRENSNRNLALVPVDPAGPPVSPTTYFYESTPSRFEEYAGFGDLTWHLTGQFDVTGGMRYAENRQRFEEFGSGYLSSSSPLSRSNESVTTYLANARYRFDEHLTTYFRYATGYRPGGPNYIANDPLTGRPIGAPTFKSDRLKSYELGLKAETEDRRFAIDVDGYHIDWDNIQVLTSSPSGFTVFANAPGGAAINGSELNFTARPIRAMTLTGAFAFQHAYLKQADASLGADQGERLPNVPRFTAALSTDYALAAENWQPTIGASVRYVDGRTSSWDHNTTYLQYRLPPYTTVDLRSGFVVHLSDSHSADVQIYIHNLFDERGQLSAMFTLATLNGTAPVAILQPRTIGVTITAHL